jgi:ATP-dependent RNA helicase RhlE
MFSHSSKHNSRNRGYEKPGRSGFKPNSRPHYSSHSNGNHSRPQRGQGGGNRQHPEFDVASYIQQMERQTPAVETPVVEYVQQHQFSDFNFDSRISENLAKRNYVHPTPIQDQIIKPGMEGKDVVGIANTGTGKTAAFLLPLLHRYLTRKINHVLILTPTRELAIQVYEELQLFARGTSAKATVCVGGANINSQIKDLRRGPAFVIGTPGRIKDLMQRDELRLDEFKAVVLDEVDRMLDMGFIHDMRTILKELPNQRQSLFFSATLDKATEEIMRQFVHDYVKVAISTPKHTNQTQQVVIYYKDSEEKLELLKELLLKPEVYKAVVFVRTKHSADKIAKKLKSAGIKVDAIHGNKTQNYRQRAMQGLKNDKIQVLVATDVAARGLDIPGLSHAINFDLPGTKEDYIHRIGRVGRGKNTDGVAVSFMQG